MQFWCRKIACVCCVLVSHTISPIHISLSTTLLAFMGALKPSYFITFFCTAYHLVCAYPKAPYNPVACVWHYVCYVYRRVVLLILVLLFYRLTSNPTRPQQVRSPFLPLNCLCHSTSPTSQHHKLTFFGIADLPRKSVIRNTSGICQLPRDRVHLLSRN